MKNGIDKMHWLTTRVEPDFKGRVRIGAALEGVDVSRFIRKALTERLERQAVKVVKATK